MNNNYNNYYKSINFRVNLINKILVTYEAKEDEIFWLEKIPPVKLFNVTIKKEKAASFAKHDWDETFVRFELEYLKKHYNVNLEEKLVYNKPYVSIYLNNEDVIKKVFNTNANANKWVETLKIKCAHIFEVINYE